MKFYFIFAINLFLGFCDDEWERLWSCIQDLHHPTLQEYQWIDAYLEGGKRVYLDEFRLSESLEDYKERLRRIENFRLVSPHNEMPISETYSFNIDEYSNGKCTILYGSSNGVYPDKARKLLSEIENCGYSGHVLLRIGGFPNTPFGGLKICHIPYAFKVAALQEAKQLGFKEILWIDLAVHPMKDFETIFWEIEQRGYFFTHVGSLQDHFSAHLPRAAEALSITTDLYEQIPHISSALIGLNMENSQALQLLDGWLKETEKGDPCMTWWPEELSLSVVAWRLQCKPSTGLGNLICNERERFQLKNRPTVQFYIDAIR